MRSTTLIDANTKIASIITQRTTATPQRFPPNEGAGGLDLPLLNHVLWMTTKVPEFVEEGRIDKAMRWLGFMQGVLWATGHFHLEELKAMNREESRD